jgi:hypothetical protein
VKSVYQALKVEVIIFDSVRFLSKKNNQTELFFKKTETELKSGQTDRFRFCSVFRIKTSSNRFDSVFSVLARFFPVLARFFWFFSVWVRFGFLLIKPKSNLTGQFF